MPLSPLHRQVEKLGRLEEILESREFLIRIDKLHRPAKAGEEKYLALTRPSSTYEKAAQIIVPDRSLRVTNIQETKTVEACPRVVATERVGRLRTLQNGALPAAKHQLWFNSSIGLSLLSITHGYHSDLRARS